MADLQTTPSYRQVHKKIRQLANVEWMLTSRIEKQKNASSISPLEHIHHHLTPHNDGQKPYTQRYGKTHSRIILTPETTFQHNLNQEKISERIDYLIPTIDLQYTSYPEPKLKPTSITSTHLGHQYTS